MPVPYKKPQDQILSIVYKRGPVMRMRQLLPLTRHHHNARSLYILLEYMQGLELLTLAKVSKVGVRGFRGLPYYHAVELTEEGINQAKQVIEDRLAN